MERQRNNLACATRSRTIKPESWPRGYPADFPMQALARFRASQIVAEIGHRRHEETEEICLRARWHARSTLMVPLNSGPLKALPLPANQ